MKKVSKDKKKKELTALEAIFIILLGLGAALFINTVLLKVYQIPSASMESTLQQGDYVAAFPLFHSVSEVKRGDVVTFVIPDTWEPQQTDELYIKRVIAVAGDTISYSFAEGKVKLNGVLLDESSYIKPGAAPSNVEFSYTVPAGEIFVMGDNRANSFDSRYHPADPFISVGAVTNRPTVRIWPVTRWEMLADESQVYKNVP